MAQIWSHGDFRLQWHEPDEHHEDVKVCNIHRPDQVWHVRVKRERLPNLVARSNMAASTRSACIVVGIQEENMQGGMLAAVLHFLAQQAAAEAVAAQDRVAVLIPAELVQHPLWAFALEQAGVQVGTAAEKGYMQIHLRKSPVLYSFDTKSKAPESQPSESGADPSRPVAANSRARVIA